MTGGRDAARNSRAGGVRRNVAARTGSGAQEPRGRPSGVPHASEPGMTDFTTAVPRRPHAASRDHFAHLSVRVTTTQREKCAPEFPAAE